MKRILSKVFSFVFILIFVITFISCSSGKGNMNMSDVYYEDFTNSEEEYLDLVETGFVDTSVNNKVNVSLDSSTAAYSNIRKLIKGEEKKFSFGKINKVADK